MNKTVIRNALKVFAVGGIATVLSAIALFLISMSVWIYCTIPTTSGYVAVVLFALATLTLAVALAGVYMCGSWMVRKGKFSK